MEDVKTPNKQAEYQEFIKNQIEIKNKNKFIERQ
jgi:hypothetical protein